MNEGELSGRLGPRRVAGRRRGGDHRPRLPARRRTSARGCTSATSPRPARWRSSAGPRRRAGTSPPRPARTTCCSPTTWPRRTTRSTRSTRRCAPPPDVEALRAGLADGTIDCVATDHAPHPHEDKDCEWAAAAFGMLGLETALSIVQETMVDPGLLDWAGVADRMSHAPGADRPGRRPRPAARRGRAGQRRALRPVRTPRGRPVRVRQPEPQHALPRHGAARPGRRDVPARAATVLDGKLA